jgi:quercetin dioxygenase-like cupin family protein
MSILPWWFDSFFPQAYITYQETENTMVHSGSLPKVNRFITTHDSEGKAIFSEKFKEELPSTLLPDGDAAFSLGYTSAGFPVDLNKDADLDVYERYMDKAPGITISNGTVLRYVDMSPGLLSPMHRTVSLDYGVVLEGEVELVLDSGETRLMKRGDVAIQRGTNHAWRNTSKTEWARMMYVLQPSQPLNVAGQKLGEDYGGMKGVRKSD